jgi:hypothetical protein
MTIAVDQHGRFTGLVGAELTAGDGRVVATETNRGIDEWNHVIANALTPAKMPSPEREQVDREAPAAKQHQATKPAGKTMER